MSEEQKNLVRSVQQLRSQSNTASQAAAMISANKQLAAGDMAAALKKGGYLSSDIALTLADIYKATPLDIAINMRNAGTPAMYVAPELRNMGMNRLDVCKTLKAAGFSAKDTGIALKHTYNMETNAIIAELYTAGYSAEQVALYAHDIANTPVHILAEIFNKLGLPAKEVVNSLSKAYDIASQVVIAQALKYAKYGAEQVASAMKDVYNLTAQGVTEVFKQAGYAANEVAAVLKNVYNQTATFVADTLKKVYNIGGEVVESILNGVGYAASAVADAMKSVFDWIKDSKINPANW